MPGAARQASALSRTRHSGNSSNARSSGPGNCTRNRTQCIGLVRDQLAAFPDSRIIIFATYRDTVQLLVDHLALNGIVSERFVGQATKDTEKGLSQKKQIAALTRFREGEFRVLVATSVGEEGLDVPSTDLVIFYEAVPSEIRSIQRKGRTGRSGAGTGRRARDERHLRRGLPPCQRQQRRSRCRRPCGRWEA